MEKRNRRWLLLIIALMAVGMIIFFGSMRNPKMVSISIPGQVIAYVPYPLPEKITAEAYSEPEEAILALEPIVEKPKTRIVERNIWSGNKGYVVLDKDYVYFGIVTTFTEEVPVK
ncbi:MAG: hypothetical protein ABH873_07060 [Candidatus Firestonebacteria bacterium]